MNDLKSASNNIRKIHSHTFAPSQVHSDPALGPALGCSKASVCNVLAASSEIFFGDAGRQLSNSLRAKELTMPSLGTVRNARLHLDLMSMRFQQQLFMRYHDLVYQLLDSSPQLGYNILGVIEDTVRVPEECTHNLLRRVELDLNLHWLSEIQPFSSHGLGKAGAVKKSVTTVNLMMMKVKTSEQLDRRRNQYRGILQRYGRREAGCRYARKHHTWPVRRMPRRGSE